MISFILVPYYLCTEKTVSLNQRNISLIYGLRKFCQFKEISLIQRNRFVYIKEISFELSKLSSIQKKIFFDSRVEVSSKFYVFRYCLPPASSHLPLLWYFSKYLEPELILIRYAVQNRSKLNVIFSPEKLLKRGQIAFSAQFCLNKGLVSGSKYIDIKEIVFWVWESLHGLRYKNLYKCRLLWEILL